MNTKGEFIHRTQNETYYTLQTPAQKKQEPYPWEEASTNREQKEE